ncbi:hypothetical protein DV451_001816 [Geotrichum candidum]|uniref:L-fuconate dehydratase n=1 Tax=Geotrichum candidum TaxID=1173061 RepID=A0A9P5G613_GEOCN|nr:hypothetical protein DV451_001816 [Geotrichum candidum]
MVTITSFETKDIRFPTHLDRTGSDAMNKMCDYSAAYVVLHTDSGIHGHGMTFTIGRGNDVVCEAIKYFGQKLVGKTLEELTKSIGKTWKWLVSDEQLRWIGPEKGVVHLALGAAINAVWDLWAKDEKKPVWQLVAEFTPEQFVDAIDFRYLTDAITPEEAIELLRKSEPGKQERIELAKKNQAVPVYTTSAGWLGYSDDKIKRLLQESIDSGYTTFKFKVGGNLEDDKRRLEMAREIIGYDDKYVIMIDANQVWSVPEAIDYVKALAQYKPWFIEEPTSPDDILGHLAIKNALKADGIKVATGEMCQNRIMFKQFITSGAIDIVQVDSCRLGGLNEVLAVLLLAKKYGLPVVPHSGGVGLPEYTQHISTIDFINVAAEKSLLEYVSHLHENFIEPAEVEDGYVITPKLPGYSIEMKPEAWTKYQYPTGQFWSEYIAKGGEASDPQPE